MMIFSPGLRQLYVAIPPLLAGISSGGAVAYPTVLLHQLGGNDTTIQLDFNTASWMGSIHGIAGIPSIFMPILMQWKGRKLVFILSCLVTITGWLMAAFASTTTALLVSECFHGFGTSSILAVTCLTITEQFSSKYRNSLMQSILVVETASMATDGLLTQYCHWRTISIIMLVPIVISAILACTLPESPYWLAYKGDFGQCEKNFVWLRGSDAESKKELKELMSTDYESINSFGIKSIKQFWETITQRDFFMPALHICILQFLLYGSGTVVVLVYSITILKKVTNNDQISSFGGLIMNSILCLGLCVAILFNNYFCNKTIIVWGSFCAALCLIFGSTFAYLQTIGLWPEESLVGLYCLVGYILSCSISISGCAYPVAATLMSVKYRGLGGALMLINTGLYHTAALKLAPYMFLYLDMWGTYLVYSTVCLCCGLLIYKYVPETKGRTLIDIERYYIYGKFSVEPMQGDENNDCDTIELMI